LGFGPVKTRSLEERFWPKVQKGEGCWLWTGYVDRGTGYGRMQSEQPGTLASAHKTSWIIQRGPVPDGMVVRHLCHNKLCVRIDHLKLGSAEDNVRDKVLARRQACGERQHLSKLTWKDVDHIFAMRAKGRSTYWIARQFEVARPTICAILKGKTWRHRDAVNGVGKIERISISRDKPTVEEVFWSHVIKSRGCWNWAASLNNKGYGWFRIRGKTFTAHRASWMLFRGSIPAGMCVLHKCDNPQCVRPSHLFLGTMRDNTQDMIRKGRSKFIQFSKERASQMTKKEGTTLKKGEGTSPACAEVANG